MIRLVFNLMILLVSIAGSLFAQDSTCIKHDSITSHIIHYAPYHSQPWAYSGSYVKTVRDSNLFQFSSGVNVLNVLRGQVPSLTIPIDYKQYGFSGMRTEYQSPAYNAVIMVDGVPYSNLISGYLNFNAFEYKAVKALSGNNPLAFLNGGTAGAFLLTSKTGERFDKPTVEVNSATLETNVKYKRYNPVTQKTEEATDYYWNLSNSVAYSRDFGKLDTRVSYNFQAQPNSSGLKSPLYHDLKVNTGVDVSDKLKLRLILEDRFSSWKTSGLDKTDHNFLNSQVQVKYNWMKWLSISSQISYAKSDSSLTLAQDNGQVKNNRLFANALVNVGGGKNVQWFGFAGAQYVKNNRAELGSYFLSDAVSSSCSSILSGATITVKKLLSSTLLYKLNQYDVPLNKQYGNSDYLASLALVVTKLLPISFGKLRASFSSLNSVNFNTYPWVSSDILKGTYNPYAIKNFETGGDFILNSKLNFSLNYFRIKEVFDAPDNVFPALMERNRKGWELDFQYKVIQRGNFKYSAGLLVSTFQTKTVIKGLDGEKYTNPSMRNSWFNQVSFNNMVATVLIESIQNKEMFQVSSFVKLREISLGWHFREILTKRSFISISGRNLYKFSGTGSDYEAKPLYNLAILSQGKSVSLNINVIL